MTAFTLEIPSDAYSRRRLADPRGRPGFTLAGALSVAVGLLGMFAARPFR